MLYTFGSVLFGSHYLYDLFCVCKFKLCRSRHGFACCTFHDVDGNGVLMM